MFNKSEVALILACGVRKYQEYQALKGKREDRDIISVSTAAEEVRHEQKDADGGDPRLQIPVPRRGIDEGAVRHHQARGGGEDSSYTFDSHGK